MARSGLVASPKGTITQLTNADVTGTITFQHRGGNDALLIGTTDATTPSVSDFDDGLKYQSGQGEAGMALSDLFPGSSYVRLWSYSQDGCEFSVYHA